MSKKIKQPSITMAELHRTWMKDPDYVREYDALEDEFALAETLIGARARAKLSQEQLAERMGTAQSFIARLESGKTLPSTATLKRFAEATGSRLKVTLEPMKRARAQA
jgi:ribosome-binding protein aMBF1 (putative translation factor)